VSFELTPGRLTAGRKISGDGPLPSEAGPSVHKSLGNYKKFEPGSEKRHGWTTLSRSITLHCFDERG
jgi:hypothetical protein